MKNNPRKGGLMKMAAASMAFIGGLFGRQPKDPGPAPGIHAPPKLPKGSAGGDPFLAGLRSIQAPQGNPSFQSQPKGKQYKNARRRRAARGGKPRALRHHRGNRGNAGGHILILIALAFILISLALALMGCSSTKLPLYFEDEQELDAWVQDNCWILVETGIQEDCVEVTPIERKEAQ